MLEVLGHRITWPSKKTTLKPVSSKKEIERIFFFKACMNNTYLIGIELLEWRLLLLL
jgi:hypothetical protein